MDFQSVLNGITGFFSGLGQAMEPMVQWLETGLAAIPASFSQIDEAYGSFYMSMVRYGCPILAALLLLRCAMPLLTFRREPEIWAWLVMPGGERHRQEQKLRCVHRPVHRLPEPCGADPV